MQLENGVNVVLVQERDVALDRLLIHLTGGPVGGVVDGKPAALIQRHSNRIHVPCRDGLDGAFGVGTIKDAGAFDALVLGARSIHPVKDNGRAIVARVEAARVASRGVWFREISNDRAFDLQCRRRGRVGSAAIRAAGADDTSGTTLGTGFTIARHAVARSASGEQ